MERALDQILAVDCIQGMAKLAEGSVDLVFADPPFNIGYAYDVYRDHREADEYLAWSERWISQVRRILKPDGTFWLAIGDEFAAELKVLCTRTLGFHCRSWVVWYYTFGVHCTNKFTRSHAHLFYFVKEPKCFTFNSLAVRVPSARELVYGDKRADPDGRVPDDTWMTTPVLPAEVPTRDGFILRPQDIPQRFPPHSDTWYFSRVAGTFGERRGWHGCQMPEQLLGRIVRACSKEADVVLDPFGGSGTTLAVAKKLGRRFLGFELSEEYARRIEERLAGIRPGDALVGPENPVESAPRTHMGRRLRREPPPPAVVSHSPVVTSTNVTLGQVAVANGELATAVAEAFMTAHQGYSADRVLADPAINDAFLESCRLLGLPGDAREWNHLLLNVRKRGGLVAIPTSRRTRMTQTEMEPYFFASEIAWRRLSEDFTYSLDDILCDPELAASFDRTARSISPGYSSFHYRWAALALRKDAARGDHLLPQVNGSLSPTVRRPQDRDLLPSAPGHYLLRMGETSFFVGYSTSLRTCPFFNPDRLAAASEAMGRPIRSGQEITLRTRIVAANRGHDGERLVWARRSRLLLRYQPIANIPVSRPNVA